MTLARAVIAAQTDTGCDPLAVRWASAWMELETQRFTGVVLVHLHQGIPKQVEVSRPGVKIRIKR